MISRQEVERLGALRCDAGIVSAYIKVNPHLMHEPTHTVTEFKGAAKRFTSSPDSAAWLQALEREKPRMLRFLQDWRPFGRGLAVFACEPAGIWEVVHLDVDVPNRIAIDLAAHTAVLARILDEHAGFVVALVQRDRAALFIAEQRVVREREEITTPMPRRHDQGGWSQTRYQRHVEFHVNEHLKRVEEELQKLYQQRRFDRLAVGGSDETASQFVKLLPDPIARCLIGTFAVDVKHGSEEDTLQRATRLWLEHERRSERELVDKVVEQARAGGRGALGPRPTLEAIQQQRVQTLLVADGLSLPGSVCTRCEYFSIDRFDACPLCASGSEAADIAEWAVEAVVRLGGAVEVVCDQARDRLNAEGGIAALLRY